jgi:hypothetical protein
MATKRTLQFHRAHDMAHQAMYSAEGANHFYHVFRDGKDWVLLIFEVEEFLGMRLTGNRVAGIALDRKGDATAVAAAFEELGDDYRPSQHGGRARFSVAIQRGFGEHGVEC